MPAEPYIGQIMPFAGNFAPEGWALCDGSLLPISQYDALFSLIGTTYGGDGQTTFALPDLRSRVPIHQGQGPGLSSYVLGENGGARGCHAAIQPAAGAYPPGHGQFRRRNQHGSYRRCLGQRPYQHIHRRRLS